MNMPRISIMTRTVTITMVTERPADCRASEAMVVISREIIACPKQFARASMEMCIRDRSMCS